MNSKKIFHFFLVLLALGLFASLAIGCNVADTIPMSLPTATNAPTETLLPLLPTPTYAYPTLTPVPTDIPYPTASVVKANAVAFISSEKEGYSLWVANVDGSGEKKLVDIIHNYDWAYDQKLQWSPDGRWIIYFSQDKLWIVSRDGLVNRSLLSLPDKSVGYLIIYVWSPDSSKIAYLEALSENSTVTPNVTTPTPGPYTSPYLVGMIDIATGNVSELSSFEANAGIPVLSWSPNGRTLLFIKDFSLVLFDVAARKVVKTIKRGCGLERGLSWSPNGKWFSYTDNGVGGFNPTWICVNNVTGDLIHEIYVDSTSFNPIWDKTGNYLYFLAAKIDLARKPDPLIDERLMRYDARTQEIETLLSLKEQQQPNSYIRYLSISPDGNTLMLQSESSQTKIDLIFVDIQSLTITKSTIDFGTLPNDSYPHITNYGWSPDGEDIIFFFTKLYWINTYGYIDHGYFYALDIRTGNISIFSGWRTAENVQVSPVTTVP